MSKTAPESVSSIAYDGRIAIVASKYNSKFTDALVDSASESLQRLCPGASLDIYRVPGAFEIPVVVEKLARDCDNAPGAVLALGVIIRGSTAHADLIAESITHSLHRSSLDHCIPVIHEVLLVESSEQAEVRTLGDELNRGREAAEAAVAMIEVMSAIS